MRITMEYQPLDLHKTYVMCYTFTVHITMLHTSDLTRCDVGVSLPHKYRAKADALIFVITIFVVMLLIFLYADSVMQQS
jgi:hypothetical protein